MPLDLSTRGSRSRCVFALGAVAACATGLRWTTRTRHKTVCGSTTTSRFSTCCPHSGAGAPEGHPLWPRPHRPRHRLRRHVPGHRWDGRAGPRLRHPDGFICWGGAGRNLGGREGIARKGVTVGPFENLTCCTGNRPGAAVLAAWGIVRFCLASNRLRYTTFFGGSWRCAVKFFNLWLARLVQGAGPGGKRLAGIWPARRELRGKE